MFMMAYDFSLLGIALAKVMMQLIGVIISWVTVEVSVLKN